jgi:hypothetical protein
MYYDNYICIEKVEIWLAYQRTYLIFLDSFPSQSNEILHEEEKKTLTEILHFTFYFPVSILFIPPVFIFYILPKEQQSLFIY